MSRWANDATDSRLPYYPSMLWIVNVAAYESHVCTVLKEVSTAAILSRTGTVRMLKSLHNGNHEAIQKVDRCFGLPNARALSQIEASNSRCRFFRANLVT